MRKNKEDMDYEKKRNIFLKIIDRIRVYILNQNCYSCTSIEMLDKPTRFMEKAFCKNALGFDGLEEPLKTSICKLWKRKKKYSN